MDKRSSRLKAPLWLLMLLWTGVVFGLFLLDGRHLNQTVKDLATAEARACLTKDQAIRLWAASHGGVYVPISEATKPNPFLSHLPERDIQTPSGKPLTLMNPAYMLRQVMEHYAWLHGVRGRIIGLKHFSEATAPDDWEKSALLAFKSGNDEHLEFTEIEGSPVLRAIRALSTESECLKCHAHQGYQAGDVRGGVSISVPMASYLSYHKEEMVIHGLSFACLWLIGLVGTFWADRKLSRSIRMRDQAETQLRLSQKNYMALVSNSLTGIYINQGNQIQFANARFAEIHGYAPEQIVGVNILNLIHPDDRPFVEDLAERRLKGENVVNEYEIRCLGKEGKTIWVNRRNTLIEYNGEPAILGNEVDISRQKEAEDSLRASEQQLKKLSTRLLQQQEVEKKDIARGIHEDVAQCLAAIKLRVESVLDELAGEEYGPSIVALKPIISDVQHGIKSIRKMAQNISPLLLNDMGLGPAISWICQEATKANPNLRVNQDLHVEMSKISERLGIIIFRTVEDSLKIVSGSAKVVQVDIVLQSSEERFLLKVKMHHIFDSSAKSVSDGDLFISLDIPKMKTRVESCEGEFKFDTPQINVAVLTAIWRL